MPEVKRASKAKWPISATCWASLAAAAVGGGLLLALMRSYWFPASPSAIEAFPGSLEWEYSAQERVISSTIAHDGRAFVRTSEAIYALNAVDGQVLWEAESVGSCQRTIDPVVGNGVVLVPEVDSGVAAFSEADGRLLWRKGPPKTEPLQAELEVSDALPNWPGQPHGIDVAAVALDAERAYVARTNWLLASYALHDGQLLWAVRVPDRASLHLAVQGSRLFMGAEGSLYVYDAEDGTALDVIELANAIGPVLRDGDSLYLITAHPEMSILSIDARSLEVLWSRTAPVAVPGYENTLTSSDGKLYLSGERVAAYDVKDGDLLWQTAPGGPYGQAVPMASMLFVRENGPKLVVIDATNGELKGALRLQTNDPFGCLSSRNPASTASLLIVPFGDERVLAYRTAP